MELLPVIVILAILLGLPALGNWLEYRDWNGGKCRCGHAWKYFKTDSQGGRGYKCDACNNHVWISWPVDRKYGE